MSWSPRGRPTISPSWSTPLARPAAEGRDAQPSQRRLHDAELHASELSLSWYEGDERLAFLPLCHVAERIAGSYYSVATGVCSNFAESPETVPDNIREVQPTLFGAVPRVWEKFYAGITIALKDATPLQQWAYRRAIAAGLAIADARLARRAPTALEKLRFQAAYWLVLKNIRRMIGLDRCRWLFTGAAPISPELIRWYLALGLDMYEVYGQTENCGLATAMPADGIKLGTVGKSVPYGQVAISPVGEILIKGDMVFMGYLNQPEKTAETVDKDGWLHTGDVGLIDEEWLRQDHRPDEGHHHHGGRQEHHAFRDREPAQGVALHQRCRRHRRQAGYLTCLVMIERENGREVRAGHRRPLHQLHSLCRAKEVQDLIWSEIEKVNANFARVETIKRFYLIEQQLTPDEELTPTMKLKRSFVNTKYKEQIDAMYRPQAA